MANASDMPYGNAKRALAARAARQWGCVSAAQLRQLAVPRSTVGEWRRHGYLHPILPGVYAVGHANRSLEARCAGALLYAGPGAMLSHATAAWWLGLLTDEPRVIHISTPRRCRSQPGVRVHGRRTCPRIWHRDLTTTTVAQTIVDLAACVSLRKLRYALANADYRDLLDLEAIEPLLGRRPPGVARLRTALRRHEPQLARTKSGLETAFLELCEEAGFAPPETNLRRHGWEIDALWPEQRIAVELDGGGNHRTAAQMRRDRQKDLTLRSHGLTPVRYSDEQLDHHRPEVIADLARVGAPRKPRARRRNAA